MLGRLFRNNPQRDAAHSLYIAAMDQARNPAFYLDFAVPDTFDARFDMLTMHVYLLMRALKRGPEASADTRKAMSQLLFDAMFRNLDDTLRQMGVGDLSVAKKIRPMAEAFYGRAQSYEQAMGSTGLDIDDMQPGTELMEEGATNPAKPGKEDTLAKVLLRNVYGHIDPSTETDLASHAHGLALYMGRCETQLASQPDGRLLSGIVQFPKPSRSSMVT